MDCHGFSFVNLIRVDLFNPYLSMFLLGIPTCSFLCRRRGCEPVLLNAIIDVIAKIDVAFAI
jgi:hypothetical protein